MAAIIRINTNPNAKPYVGIPTKNWSEHAFNSRMTTGPYGNDYYDSNKKPDNIKVNSAPRTAAGVTPKTSTVARLFRPSRGGGIGGIMGNKQR